MISGFFMAFTMSMDDFVITYFTKGAGVNTLSTMIYGEIRKGIKPEMYALSTIIFTFVFIILIVVNKCSVLNHAGTISIPMQEGVVMKKMLSLMVAFIFVFASGCADSQSYATKNNKGDTLTIFNYGEYLDPGVMEAFTGETGIKVKYEEAVTPEEMYTKYKAGAIKYDLLCTSDYMMKRLIEEES